MNKSGFHLNIAGWVPALLSVLIVQASCGRKIRSTQTHTVSIAQSQIKREFVYYPKPKPVEVVSLGRPGLTCGPCSFDSVPPRRVTLYWLVSDSVNPAVFKGDTVKGKISRAKMFLIKAEKTKDLDKEKHYRKKAARLIRRAPFAQGCRKYRHENMLQSVYLLRYYMPAYRMHRKLKKYGPEIVAGGTPEERQRYAFLKEAAGIRTRAEKTRATLRTIKVILIVAYILLGLSSPYFMTFSYHGPMPF